MASTNSGDPVEHSRKRKERAPSTNPDDIVDGPRKRKETTRVTDNADPLLPKNKKAKTAPQPKRPTAKASQASKATGSAQGGSSRHPSVGLEEVEDEENLVQRVQPTNPSRILEAGDGSDDDDDSPEVIGTSKESGKKPTESAENELGTSIITMINYMPHQKNRAPRQRLELPHLCIL